MTNKDEDRNTVKINGESDKGTQEEVDMIDDHDDKNMDNDHDN